MKDYNCTIEYHPGKANVVVDALSRKTRGHLRVAPTELVRHMAELGVEIREWIEHGYKAVLVAESPLVKKIIKCQLGDWYLQATMAKGKRLEFI